MLIMTMPVFAATQNGTEQVSTGSTNENKVTSNDGTGNENSNAKLIVTKNDKGEFCDKLEYTFTMDKDAVGTWVAIGFFNDLSAFDPTQPPRKDFFWTGNTIYPDGSMTMYRSGGETITDLNWTNGYFIGLVNVVPAYKIDHINGKAYMAAEWKGMNYAKTGKSYSDGYYVFEKTSDIIMGDDSAKLTISKDKDGVIHESLKYTFTPDDRIVGEWKAIGGCYGEMGEFDPNNVQPYKQWYVGNSIYADGTMAQHVLQGDDRRPNNITHHWTKGYIVDLMVESGKEGAIPAYSIVTMNNKTYMFLEWKSNDYVTGGQAPAYYVFEKTSDTPAGATK
jgi:hypothetical protein